MFALISVWSLMETLNTIMNLYMGILLYLVVYGVVVYKLNQN